MEAITVVQPHSSLFTPPRTNRRIAMHGHAAVRSLFTLSAITDNSTVDKSVASARVYNDNWFDRLAIGHLSHSLQSSTGLRSDKKGYDGLVEAATMVSRRFTPMQQRSLVIQTLETAFPRPILSLAKKIKALMPPSSKFAREYFAVFTTIFFSWLVGPCEVKESELEAGKRERNVVYVPKCRFLEGTNCVGMCTNLCKMPSQAFIKESLGMPINMVPNFEDMSCEMIFGQEPPSQSSDPAFVQPCFKQCKEVRKHHKNCTS